MKKILKFKYSICSYSTSFRRNVLFWLKRLNTASVLIQPSLTGRSLKSKSFKYSICSYSTKVDILRTKLEERLNTASVLIQLACLVRMYPRCLSLNTASVLIQRFWDIEKNSRKRV